MPRLKRLDTTSVIVRNEAGQFLGVSRKDNYNLWGFAGGKCDKGELPEDCARRELLEETGLIATKLKLVDVREYRNQYVRPNTIDTVYCYEVEEYKGTLHSEDYLKEHNEGMLKWIGVPELIVGAFGDYNRAILQQYYDLKSIYLVEQFADYEGGEVLAAFTNEEDAIRYCDQHAEHTNKRWGREYFKKVADGHYQESGGTLTVNECLIDVDFYERD